MNHALAAEIKRLHSIIRDCEEEIADLKTTIRLTTESRDTWRTIAQNWEFIRKLEKVQS